jgi:hypothetical protein
MLPGIISDQPDGKVVCRSHQMGVSVEKQGEFDFYPQAEVQNNMEEQIQKIEVAAKKTWPVIMAWISGITAVIGFIATITAAGPG